ncbi:MAG: putative Ig domain-containing protein [Mycoplasmataceae bacterium]|nr:putative Ig domain-containing protein [Mycoplasmataceae bacterium]
METYNYTYNITWFENRPGSYLNYAYNSVDDPYLSIGDKYLYLYILKPNYAIDAQITTNTGEEYDCNLLKCNSKPFEGNITFQIEEAGKYYYIYNSINDFLDGLQSNYNITASGTQTENYIEFKDYNFKCEYTDNTYAIGNSRIIIDPNIYIDFNNWNSSDIELQYNYNNLFVHDLVEYIQTANKELPTNAYTVINENKTVNNGTVNIHYENTSDTPIPIVIRYGTVNSNINKLYVNKTIYQLLAINYDTNSFTIPIGYSFNTTPNITGGGTITSFSNTLPPGLIFDNITGNISGVPSSVGTYQFSVTVSADGKTNETILTFVITSNVFNYADSVKVSEDMTLSPTGLPQAYNNGTLSFETVLSPGITFNSNTCVISIVKSEISDENNIIITVTESLANTTLSYSENILIYLKKYIQYESNKIILPSTNFTSILLQPIVDETSYTVTATGLPTGLTISNNGNIYNNDTTISIGEYEVNIHYVDSQVTLDYTLLLEIVNFKSLIDYNVDYIYMVNSDIEITPVLNLDNYFLNFTTDNTDFDLNSNTGSITGIQNRGVYNLTVNCVAQSEYNVLNLYDNIIIYVGTLYKLYSLMNKFKYIIFK